MPQITMARATLLLMIVIVPTSCARFPGTVRDCASWINLRTGEPTPLADMLDDLETVRVIYIGERHTIDRHHDLQRLVVEALSERGVPLALGLEQLESFNQAHLDRYAAGEIDFDELAAATEWSERWRNYEEYRGVLKAARAAEAPMIALNGRAETIRAVARGGGVAKLDGELRGELPDDLQLDDPDYESLLATQMMAHAHVDEEMLRPIVEAQIARDESMADAAAEFLTSPRGAGRTLIVLTGAGHVNYGLGTVARVRRRVPGVADRIVILSQSGELEIDLEAAGGREVPLDMPALRALSRPLADYLHVVCRD